MRKKRIKIEGAEACYHVVSRVVDRSFRLDDVEKEIFRKIMRKGEAFCGVRILTYAIMSNHFHLLVCVPAPDPVDDGTLVGRVEALYGAGEARAVRRRWEAWRKDGKDVSVDEERQALLRRMGDISEFLKLVKQRYSISYNARKNRVGTLWEERFRSVLVEGSHATLSAVATYIDLNPVRAGIVKDPKDYRWSGYGEAVGRGGEAKSALAAVSGDGPWRESAAQYRRLLYEHAAPTAARAGVPAEDAAVIKSGAFPAISLTGRRVRYFTCGVVLGSRAFVEEVVRAHRDAFGTWKAGAHRLCVLRDEMFAAHVPRPGSVAAC